MNDASFAASLDRTAADIEALLDRLLAPAPVVGEIERPERLLAAMRYAVLGGGKRLRPFLVRGSAALFAVPDERALMVGAALECVHGYSLVHDDLPAMDDADTRRGRPSVHCAFDEATAVLAGTSLLTFAFDLLGRVETHPDSMVRTELVVALARAAGVGGMAGGQMLDLTAEGRFAAPGDKAQLTEQAITTLQAMKTGALMRFACMAGAILGGANEKARAALDTYGAALGEAFQVADDLLDVDGDPTLLGKSTGQDASKATFVHLLGVDGARARLATLTEKAQAALAPFGAAADMLRATARFVAKRRS
jgi:farnesyl diphosphate synthase